MLQFASRGSNPSKRTKKRLRSGLSGCVSETVTTVIVEPLLKRGSTYRIPWSGNFWIEQQFHQRYISVYLAASWYCPLQVCYNPKYFYSLSNNFFVLFKVDHMFQEFLKIQVLQPGDHSVAAGAIVSRNLFLKKI